MKKVLRLNENDLFRIVSRIITEESEHALNLYKSWATKKSGNPNLAMSIKDDYFNLRHRLGVKDFAKYGSAEELKKALDVVKSSVEKKQKANDAVKLWDDENVLVIAARTHEASCRYAAGTKWCTGAEDTDVHWKRHHQAGTEFIWINKKLDKTNSKYKLSLHIKWNENGTNFNSDWCDALNNCNPKSPYIETEINFPNYEKAFEACLNFHGVRNNVRTSERETRIKHIKPILNKVSELYFDMFPEQFAGAWGSYIDMGLEDMIDFPIYDFNMDKQMDDEELSDIFEDCIEYIRNGLEKKYEQYYEQVKSTLHGYFMNFVEHELKNGIIDTVFEDGYEDKLGLWVEEQFQDETIMEVIMEVLNNDDYNLMDEFFKTKGWAKKK